MTQAVDILSTRARELAFELRGRLLLIASKVIALHRRRGKPKAGTDWRDLAMLLHAFPRIKKHPGPVSDHVASSAPDALNTWQDLVSQELSAEEEEGF
jgi:hypothetical protein